MEIKSKIPAESLTIMTEMVMPNDTNPLNNLMGGNLLRWMDVTGGICARRHANEVCVTVAVDHVTFYTPIRLGEIVTLTAKVTRVFRSSMEVQIIVEAEGFDIENRRTTNEAYFTFVGIDKTGKTVAINPLEPVTEIEKKVYQSAQNRRELRLIQAGKMKPSQSEGLKSLLKDQ